MLTCAHAAEGPARLCPAMASARCSTHHGCYMSSASRAANFISLLLLQRGGHGIAQRSMRALGVRWRASESGASMVSMEAPSAPYRDLHFPQHTNPLRCVALQHQRRRSRGARSPAKSAYREWLSQHGFLHAAAHQAQRCLTCQSRLRHYCACARAQVEGGWVTVVRVLSAPLEAHLIRSCSKLRVLLLSVGTCCGRGHASWLVPGSSPRPAAACCKGRAGH